jgi:arylsulfatase A-like enzyme
LWDNKQKVALTGNTGVDKQDYAPLKIHQKAMEFIEKNRDTTFFLYYPMVIPHAELAAPTGYMNRYRDKFLPEKKFTGVDRGEGFRNGAYGSQPEAHAAFAAMMNLLDDQVGEVISKINDLDLRENTIIIFTSDNGPHQEGGADPDYFDSNGILRGYKRDLYEGGIRVPFIISWKGHIKEGAVSDHVSAFWDFLPTVADLLNLQIKEKNDGVSFLPTLLGDQKQPQHKHLYWEFHELNGRRALRKGDWKLVQYGVGKFPAGGFELYNLISDPSEQHNVADRFPAKVNSLKNILLSERTPSETFKFASEK